MRAPLLLSAALALLPVHLLAATPSISTGNALSVVLKADGTLLTWGENLDGELGDGTTTSRSTPVRVIGLTDVSAAWAGDFHTIALKNDGTVWTWGLNGFGQVGDGTTVSRPNPKQVSGLTGISAVKATWHSLVLRNDGTVWAWGYNSYGQLGDGTKLNKYAPVPVANLTGVSAIAMGYPFSLALKSDGTVWAWGGNGNGALGDGTFIDRVTAGQVPGLNNVAAISARDYHALALRSDGTVWAWGDNAYGQLGDGTTTMRPSPVQVSGLTGVSAISAGYGHSLALKSDGTVWAWGANSSGSLGDGTTTMRTIPVKVTALTSVAAISAGDFRSQALKNDGSVWAWGDNAGGKLGNGTSTNQTTPVAVRGENGAGTLNLGASAPIQVIAPVIINAGRVTVTATATFPPQYVGRRIYLFAYVPRALVQSLASKDGPDCVLAKITPSGPAAVSGPGDLFSNNIVNGVKQSIEMISSVLISKVAGATLCVGTGSTGADAISPGSFVCPASVLDAAGAVCQPPAAGDTLSGTGVTTKTLGSRGSVSPSNTLYGGFELSNSAKVYILVRGNSLGSLSVTQNFLDAPRVRLFNSAGQDILGDSTGPGFNGCSTSATGATAVVNYYSARGIPAHLRDACTSQTLAAGPYTFSVTPTAGLSSPNSGEILFEVTLGGGIGSIAKTLGSRASVAQATTLFGGFEIANSSNVFILVRGNSLGILGVTQTYLDAPRVRIYDASGHDIVTTPGGTAGFNGCEAARPNQLPVLNYYQNVRRTPAAPRDACISQSLSPGTYTFSVTPSIPGVTSTDARSTPPSGEVLFEVTLQ